MRTYAPRRCAAISFVVSAGMSKRNCAIQISPLTGVASIAVASWAMIACSCLLDPFGLLKTVRLRGAQPIAGPAAARARAADRGFGPIGGVAFAALAALFLALALAFLALRVAFWTACWRLRPASAS